MRNRSRAMTTMAVTLCAAALVSGGAAQTQEPETKPAAAVRVWTGDVTSDEPVQDNLEPLRPVSIVGARNGTFSGKVVVASVASIQGLRASAGALSGPGTVIPPDNVQVRYGVAWEQRVPQLRRLNGWQRRGWPAGQDILLESPPVDVSPGRRASAQVALWLTVKVPREAEAGTYTGQLTVQADGLAPVKVPLKLDVADWTLPDPQDFRMWMDVVESPDTLALEYNVPPWSDKHWELIARSLRFINATGSRVLYVPLICGTNFGNAESMVRWIRKAENQYEHDFAVMDTYLDVAEKNLGKPKLVIFLVWDIYLSLRPVYAKHNPASGTARKALRGMGPRVTVVDPASGKTEMVYLPRYEDPVSKALWEPVWEAVRRRMERRGLAQTMMLGMLSDTWPSKDEVAVLGELSGNLPWASHAHHNCLQGRPAMGNGILHKLADVGYAASVYNLSFQANPARGRDYGWRRPQLTADFPRHGIINGSCVSVRNLPALNITGGQRGLGRLGADIWPAIKDKKGRRAGSVCALYPENSARNLGLENWLLAPGPTGALATARYENLREGIQECEARIVIEDALLDTDKRHKVGEDLARRCQELLDEHHRALWKSYGVSDKDLESQGKVTGKQPIEALWNGIAREEGLPAHDYALRAVRKRMSVDKGRRWWLESGWQERNRRLFALTGEVAAKLRR